MPHIEINARRAIALLFFGVLSAELFFVLADAFINVGRMTELSPIRRFFNITREDGVASWFGTTQTWMVGMTALLVYVVVRTQDGVRWRRLGWGIVTLFLLYMALDDGAELHERIGSSVKELLDLDNNGSDARGLGLFPSYTWQLVFLPIFGSFGLFLLWFLNKELQSIRDKRLVVVAIGLLVLAVVADFFEGMDMGASYNLHGWIKRTWDLSNYQVRHFSKSFEEFVEMFAMTLLWMVFLRHLVRIAPRFQVRFKNPPR